MVSHFLLGAVKAACGGLAGCRAGVAWRTRCGFAPKYATPLRAFLSMRDEPEKIQSVIERGFTIEVANAKLTTILAEDAFLAQCCGDIEHLAHALDLLFLHAYLLQLI